MEPKPASQPVNPQDYTAEGFERYRRSLEVTPKPTKHNFARRALAIARAFIKGTVEGLPHDPADLVPKYPTYKNLTDPFESDKQNNPK